MEYIYYKGFKIWYISPNDPRFPSWKFAMHPNGFYSYASPKVNMTIDYSELSDLVKYIDYFEDTETITIHESSFKSDYDRLSAFSKKVGNWGYISDTARHLMARIDRKGYDMHMNNKGRRAVCKAFGIKGKIVDDEYISFRATKLERQVYLKAINE